MCRLYAVRTGADASARRALLDAPHALLKQSCRDSFGESHADGWGIGYYAEPFPLLERGTAPAGEDSEFAAAAGRAHGRTIVAHVRAASIGVPSLTNTHPFKHGRWLFAHNGTVTGFDRVGPALEADTEPGLLACRRGTTDSELLFYWLLGRMTRAGVDFDGPTDVGRLARLVGSAVLDLADRCERAGATEPAGLNLVLTDGEVLVASRWGRSLHWLAENDAVHVASEPPWPVGWQEVPERNIVAVDAAVRVFLMPVAGSPRNDPPP